MKKIILILTAMFLITAAFAQTSDKKAAPAPTAAQSKKQAMHYVFMGGKMSTCYGETYEPMATDMKLHDGMMVSTKGEVTVKGGKKVQLKEGECVDMDGKAMDHKMAHANDSKKKM